MATSVWLEEVNIGLLEELRKSIFIKSAEGEIIPLPEPEKAFTVRKPEEEFKFEVFPCVSIYNRGEAFQYIRHNPIPEVISRNPESASITLEDHAIPYDLDYQIDFWSRFQTDMDDMVYWWIQDHFRQFNLPVIDKGGNKRTVNCIQRGNIGKSDLVSEGERLFHSFITLTIWVEIDEERSYNKAMATRVYIDPPPKNRRDR